MSAEEREGANPLGWGKADESARDDDTEREVEDAQIRDPDRPAGREREHQPEERERGA